MLRRVQEGKVTPRATLPMYVRRRIETARCSAVRFRLSSMLAPRLPAAAPAGRARRCPPSSPQETARVRREAPRRSRDSSRGCHAHGTPDREMSGSALPFHWKALGRGQRIINVKSTARRLALRSASVATVRRSQLMTGFLVLSRPALGLDVPGAGMQDARESRKFPHVLARKGEPWVAQSGKAPRQGISSQTPPCHRAKTCVCEDASALAACANWERPRRVASDEPTRRCEEVQDLDNPRQGAPGPSTTSQDAARHFHVCSELPRRECNTGTGTGTGTSDTSGGSVTGVGWWWAGD